MTSKTERIATPDCVRYGGIAASDHPRILVPIRYPLTPPNIHTLERAGQVADERDAKEVVVFHVNPLHHARSVPAGEISSAITVVIPEQPVSLSINRSILVEEAILDEARLIGADIIVLGQTKKAAWRRVLNRIVGNGPDIVAFLCAHTDAEIIVVE